MEVMKGEGYSATGFAFYAPFMRRQWIRQISQSPYVFCKSISDKSGHDATGMMYGTRRAVWCGLSLPLLGGSRVWRRP